MRGKGSLMPSKPIISADDNFKFGAVDGIAKPAIVLAATADVALGALAPLVGDWAGRGFNTIFRPFNPKFPSQLPKPPAPGDPAEDNILELNVTTEKLAFTRIAGDIPNRGTIQEDIVLAGLTYLQQVTDVLSNTGIHIEPGIWVVVPEATRAGQDVQVTRMASIPHGTTINAIGSTNTHAGPPNIPPVDITPIVLATGGTAPFRSQKVTNNDAARLPQDLTALSAAGTITQKMITDPNSVIRDVIATQTIISTTEISILADGPPVPATGGGTVNIPFLIPNANAVRMQATFYIETVEAKITIPPHRIGDPPVRVPLEPTPGHPAPHLLIDPAREVLEPTTITFRFLQLQYTQNVFLNFNGLRWPHVSVATLHPNTALTVPPTAW